MSASEQRTASITETVQRVVVQTSRADSVQVSVLWAVAAAACFHLAYSSPWLAAFIFGYAFCFVRLAAARSIRTAFYCGLTTGLLIAGPQLWFFWTIFRGASIALWLVFAFWTAVFAALARAALQQFGDIACLLFPIFWTGIEYFRSELYYLKFSWLNIGYAFAGTPTSAFLHIAGMYGAGFCAFFAAAMVSPLPSPRTRRIFVRIFAGVIFIVLLAGIFESSIGVKYGARFLTVTGIQAEFPPTFEVIADLNRALALYPGTDLFMLSEYTFDGPVPAEVTKWCKSHQKYLVAGGKDSVTKDTFYNSAFVVGPGGEVVFKQVKSVPIQFFKDGLPAPSQKVWKSPWGRLGICICYDLSYTRVTDRLIRMGAQGLLCPTMDVVDWGRHQHFLHARVTPVRAAEYEVPIFRVASSGISQLVDSSGHVVARTPFGEQNFIFHGRMRLGGPGGTLPLDRWLGPACVAVTLAFVLWMLYRRWNRRVGTKESPESFRGVP